MYSDEFVVGLKMMLSGNRGLRGRGVEVMLGRVLPDIPEVEALRPNRSKLLRSDRQYDSESPKKISSFNSTQRTFDRKDLSNNAQ